MSREDSIERVADFSCRVCDSRHLAYLFAYGSGDEFRYYRCANCGLVNYDLSGGLDQTQYHEDYCDPTDSTLAVNITTDQTFRYLEKNIGSPGKMMDIGCGFGRLLYRMREAGWKASGLELDASTAARVREELGVDVRVANFLDCEFTDHDAHAYDLVVLRHVLEHLPNSRLAMQKIDGLLKPHGYLLLEMPNIDGLTQRWRRVLLNGGLRNKRVSKDFRPGHCNEFNRRSITYLAERSGFELVDWETYSKRASLAWFYRKLPIGNKARALLRRSGTAKKGAVDTH